MVIMGGEEMKNAVHDIDIVMRPTYVTFLLLI